MSSFEKNSSTDFSEDNNDQIYEKQQNSLKYLKNPFQKDEESLFDTIGGLNTVRQVIENIHQQSNSAQKNTTKRMELVKKRQIVFLTNLLGGKNQFSDQNRIYEEDVKLAYSRNNRQNYEMFKKAIINSFIQCGFQDEIINNIQETLSKYSNDM